jgi:hypothetical protein
MQFQYKDANGIFHTIRIDFIYAVRNGNGFSCAGRALGNIHGKRIFTFVNISAKPTDDSKKSTPDDFTSIAGAYAIRHPSDPFIKAVGRRSALGAATSQIPDKQLRQAIWDNYFESHRDGKEITTGILREITEPTPIPVKVTRRRGLLHLLMNRG